MRNILRHRKESFLDITVNKRLDFLHGESGGRSSGSERKIPKDGDSVLKMKLAPVLLGQNKAGYVIFCPCLVLLIDMPESFRHFGDQRETV